MTPTDVELRLLDLLQQQGVLRTDIVQLSSQLLNASIQYACLVLTALPAGPCDPSLHILQ
jgi:hypothetical protein